MTNQHRSLSEGELSRPSDGELDALTVFHPDSLAVEAPLTIAIDPGLTQPTPGADGFEGLAVTGYTAAGEITIVAANQNDPPALYTGTVALTGSANLTTFHAMPAINLGEVVMDWGSRRLFNLHGYTLPSHLTLLDANLAETATEIPLNELGPEGATFAPDGSLWIANTSNDQDFRETSELLGSAISRRLRLLVCVRGESRRLSLRNRRNAPFLRCSAGPPTSSRREERLKWNP